MNFAWEKFSIDYKWFMSKKTKQKEDNEKRAGKETEKSRSGSNEKTDEKENWSEDQREKSYYYDDAYGYEIYNPNEDEDEQKATGTDHK